MSIRVGIVAVPQRLERAQSLANKLRAFSPHIFIDNQGLGCTENHLQAWMGIAEGNHEWSIILEDDAILSPRFTRQLPEMLEHAPSEVVSLYLGKGRPPQWQARAARAVDTGQPFIACTALLHAVAVCVQTTVVPRMVRGARIAYREGGKPIDEAITEFCKARAMPVVYCNPSLVDHDTSLPSVAQHRPEESLHQAERTAHNFGERDHWYSTFGIM